MGIFDTIKNTYKKVDTALGGYLPGGSTPSQVSASKVTPTSTAPSTPVFPGLGGGQSTQTNVTPAAANNQTNQSVAAQSYNPSRPTLSIGGSSSGSSGGLPQSTRDNVTPAATNNMTMESVAAQSTQPTAQPTTQTQPTYEQPTQGGASGYKLTKEQVANIQSGQTSVTPELKAAVDSGNYEVVNEPLFTKSDKFAIALASGEALGPLIQGAISAISIKLAGNLAVSKATQGLAAIDDIAKADDAFIKPGGENILKDIIPEAAGFIDEGTEIAVDFSKSAGPVNSQTAAKTGNWLKNLFLTQSGKVNLLGIMSATSVIVGSGTSFESSNNKIKSVLENAPEDISTLDQAGMSEDAAKYREAVENLGNTSGWLKAIPYFGRSIVGNRVNAVAKEFEVKVLEAKAAIEAADNRNQDFVASIDAKIKTNTPVTDEELLMAANLNPGGLAEQALYINMQAQATAEEERQREYAELLEKRAYEEAKLEDQRRYNEEWRDEQRRYNEEQQAAQYAQQAFDEATATEQSGSSTLTFGLLNSSGDIEFVNKDAASNAYFGKTYDELTPAQKKLLMLSKGMK